VLLWLQPRTAPVALRGPGFAGTFGFDKKSRPRDNEVCVSGQIDKTNASVLQALPNGRTQVRRSDEKLSFEINRAIGSD